MTQKILQLSLLLLTGLVLTSLVSAFASANTVATSSTAVDVRPIGADDLKPSDCAAITLTNVVVGSVNVSGTNANDLVLGSAVADVMNGAAGNDCILGGGGDDELAGAGGQDVCIGGPGTDKFKGTCNTKIQ